MAQLNLGTKTRHIPILGPNPDNKFLSLFQQLLDMNPSGQGAFFWDDSPV
ncbi:MAG: hypothetical protein AAFO96_26745 [Bacteroidota bacterium]